VEHAIHGWLLRQGFEFSSAVDWGKYAKQARTRRRAASGCLVAPIVQPAIHGWLLLHFLALASGID
jgi:hypothetical protein